MRTKYFNDAIIGNGNIVASFTKTGELLRFFYPNTDFRQFIDFLHTGVQINDSNLIYLHNDVNNEYKQYYTENTNILNTEIVNTYFNLRVLQTDFMPIKSDILVKKYKFTNEHDIDLNVNFLIYSKLLTNENNQVSGYFNNNTLMQYMHDYTLCIFSKNTPSSYQINNTQANIEDGEIWGKDYIGMSADSSISYSLGILKPGETKTLEIYMIARENNTKNYLEKIEKEVEEIKLLNISKEYENTKKYWHKYLKDHMGLELKQPKNKTEEKINTIYKRTILLFPLLTNSKTGGISAAVEIDEDRTKCGRYSYCWPRDGIFITHAMDILKMQKETEKFYKNFCKNTQSTSGMWEQRFFTDGNLAPCWGYQIDETASVVYGVYNHYKNTNDEKFIKDNLKMCEKAVHYLEKYIQDVIQEENKFALSYDIWEENEGIHTYSLAAIFSAFEAMLKMYEIVKPSYENNRLRIEQINKKTKQLEKILLQIKEYIMKNLYSNEKKSFVRSKDNKIDISLLGLVTPFNLFTPKDKKILNTVERINLTIRTYTGGYLRYEGDKYAGGNPWVIANLWLANYYIEAGNRKKALECFDYVVKSSSGHGFLGEQVNNETMKPAWVIGLGWSHAMFVIVLEKLYSREG